MQFAPCSSLRCRLYRTAPYTAFRIVQLLKLQSTAPYSAIHAVQRLTLQFAPYSSLSCSSCRTAPERALKPLLILIPSTFVPKRASSCRGSLCRTAPCAAVRIVQLLAVQFVPYSSLRDRSDAHTTSAAWAVSCDRCCFVRQLRSTVFSVGKQLL